MFFLVVGELIGTASAEKDGLQSKVSALNSLCISLGTNYDREKLYRISNVKATAIIELYLALNNTIYYGYFRILMSDGKFVINKLSGVEYNTHFYKDEFYLYIKVSGSDWVRSIVKTTFTNTDDYKYKDVTNEVDISSLTEIPLS